MHDIRNETSGVKNTQHLTIESSMASIERRGLLRNVSNNRICSWLKVRTDRSSVRERSRNPAEMHSKTRHRRCMRRSLTSRAANSGAAKPSPGTRHQNIQSESAKRRLRFRRREARSGRYGYTVSRRYLQYPGTQTAVWIRQPAYSIVRRRGKITLPYPTSVRSAVCEMPVMVVIRPVSSNRNRKDMISDGR